MLYLTPIMGTLAAVSCLSACTESPTPTPPAPMAAVSRSSSPNLAGDFSRSQPSTATLKVREDEPGRFKAVIVAGGIPDGAATAADCALEGSGAFQETSLTFEAELTGDPQSYAGQPLIVTVSIEGDQATVIDGGAAYRLCGMGSAIGGIYRRDLD